MLYIVLNDNGVNGIKKNCYTVHQWATKEKLLQGNINLYISGQQKIMGISWNYFDGCLHIVLDTIKTILCL
jgi:hypothetical protein